MKLEDLIGKRVDGLYINGDTSIKLQSGEQWYELYTDADCCSESWIAHVDGSHEGFGGVIGATITEVREVTIGEAIGTRQECDELYATYLKHDNYGGEFAIEYRNSSNGYYGGWLAVQESDDNLLGYKKLEDF